MFIWNILDIVMQLLNLNPKKRTRIEIKLFIKLFPLINNGTVDIKFNEIQPQQAAQFPV